MAVEFSISSSGLTNWLYVSFIGVVLVFVSRSFHLCGVSPSVVYRGMLAHEAVAV